MSDSASDALTCEKKGQAQHSRIINLHKTPLCVAGTFKHDLGWEAAFVPTLMLYSFDPTVLRSCMSHIYSKQLVGTTHIPGTRAGNSLSQVIEVPCG